VPSPSAGSSAENTLPLVSVVIPAYRCSQYIAQAVESVLAQSYPQREVIIVNDGSPDTPALELALRPYREKVCYITQPSRGPAAARNRGILKARGEYIAFLDADDYWSPEHLAKQMELFFADRTLELVYCDCVLLKDRPLTRAFSLQPQAPQVSFDALLVESCAIGTSTTIVLRDTIVRAGLFDESFMRCEDFEMWLRMAFRGARMAYHPYAEVFHRVSDHGLSADRLAMKKDRLRVYEKLTATLALSGRQRSVVERLAAETRRDCDIDILKHLLEAGEYRSALVVAERARSRSNTWKLRVTCTGLRIAPRLFGRLHRIRTRFVRDPYFQRALARDEVDLSKESHSATLGFDSQVSPERLDREELERISSGT
jgi:glycosyltransferase involved in cell wall biosynthesis